LNDIHATQKVELIAERSGGAGEMALRLKRGPEDGSSECQSKCCESCLVFLDLIGTVGHDEGSLYEVHANR